MRVPLRLRHEKLPLRARTACFTQRIQHSWAGVNIEGTDKCKIASRVAS